MKLRDAAIVDLFVAAMSWAAIGYVLDRTAPTLGARLALLALVFMALTSLLIPLVAVSHYLIRRELREQHLGVWVRQGALGGLFAIICLWLQMLRALNVFNALLLGGVLVLLEAMILGRGPAPPPAPEVPSE